MLIRKTVGAAVTDLGDSIEVKVFPYQRIFKLRGTQVSKDDITAIQLTHNCISLFEISGNAHDLWIPNHSIHNVAKRVINMLPTVRVVKMESV